MSLTLPSSVNPKIAWLTETPIAHRGLHDEAAGVYENTLSAARAAMEAGYAIEVDLQFSSDGLPMVFHDYTLERMTSRSGNMRDLDEKELSNLTIKDTNDTIPTLKKLLELIDGRVGIVLELKGLFGKDDGFIKSVSDALSGYKGNVVIMSFAHHLLEDAREFAPHLPLGLTAEGDDKAYSAHRSIAEKCDVDFLSYEAGNLECRFVAEFKQTGRPIICWTIRSQEEMRECLTFADQPTFETFRP